MNEGCGTKLRLINFSKPIVRFRYPLISIPQLLHSLLGFFRRMYKLLRSKQLSVHLFLTTSCGAAGYLLRGKGTGKGVLTHSSRQQVKIWLRYQTGKIIGRYRKLENNMPRSI